MMRVLTLFVLFYLPINLCAQKIQVVEGNLTKLKGTESIDVQITFDSLLVGAEIPEQTFIAEKKKLWEEKEAGKGSEWERHWHDSKSKLYRPTFNSIFAKNAGLKISSDAQYIIVIKTRQIEPVVESWGGRSFVSAEAWVVDAATPEKILAKLSLPVLKSDDYNGGDFEMGRRIQQAYVTGAKLLGKYFKEKVL